MLSLPWSGASPTLGLPQRSSLLLAGLWNLADQGLVSFANFFVMLLLARTLPATEFGAFVLVYMAIYLANNIQTSLVTRPHNIIAANLEGQEFRRYSERALALQCVIAAAFGGFAFIAAAGASLFSAQAAWLFAATGAAVFTAQLQEFTRQLQFTRGRAAEVFTYDVLSYGGQVALLALLWQAGVLTGVTAMLALAGSSAVSALYAFRRIGIAPAGSPRAALAQNWGMARWLLGDNLGQWLSTMLFPILTAVFAGTAATASYRIIVNVVAPLHVVFQALPSFAAARASRAYHAGGFRRLIAFLAPVTLLAGLPVTAYLAAVSVFGSPVLRLMYGPGHGEHAELIGLLAGAYLAQYLVSCLSAGLLAAGNARAIFIGRLVAIALTLTVGLWATATHGLAGAMAGILVTNAGLLLVLATIFSRSARQQGYPESKRGES